MEILKQEQSDENGGVLIPSADRIGDMNTLVGDDSAILRDMRSKAVSSIVIKEEQIVEYPNYIIDYSKSENTTVFQRKAIKSLINENGDIAIYLYKDDRLVKVGYGESGKIEQTIAHFRNYVADSEVKVYKDFEVGKELVEVRSRDITKLRLNL